MALTIMLAVWFANSRGILRCADDVFADVSGAHVAQTFDAETVLLVYAERSTLESASDELAKLVKSIQGLRPANIGIVHSLSPQQRDRLVSIGLTDKVFVGASLPEIASESDATSNVKRGYLDLWLTNQYVYRSHVAQVKGQHQLYQSLEALLARDRQGRQATIPLDTFGIRYRGGASSLPHVSQSAFATGSIVPELVEDRTVLIGLRDDDELGLVTPTTYNAPRMSRLELHGNILATILRKNTFSYATPSVSLLLLFVISTISCHLFRQVRSNSVLYAGLCCSVVIGLLAWLSISMWSTQLPVTAMWLVCFLTTVCVLQSRFNTLSEFFADWKLLQRVNLKITRQQSFDEIWTSVAQSALHIFHPQRLALLEIETAATHLRLREIVGCDESGIAEKRRDVSRSPYREVFEQRRPIDIEYRPFFVADGDDTVQLMVPLIHGPDPQGLLVLELLRESVEDKFDLDERLSEFADEMSGFVAGIRERELEHLLSKSLIRRIRFVPERIDSRVLYQDEMEHRDYEELLDRAIDGLQFPVAIYDVFGNLLKSNDQMTELLQGQDLSVTDAGCVEILGSLTGRDQEDCRVLVRRCLIDERSEEIVLPPTGAQQSARILYVTPLNSGDSVAETGIEHRSISIQLVDSGIFQEINQWHQGFVESQATALRSQMSRLQQFIDESATPGQTTELDQFHDLTTEIASALEQCQTAISAGVGNEPEDCFTTDIHPILTKAIEITSDESEARGVKVANESTGDGARAICNPALLRNVLVSILERLLQDASRNSVITINETRDHNHLRYRFDIVSLLQHVAGDEYSAAAPTEAAAVDSKAALVVVDPHTEWVNKTTGWLAHWGAILRVECGNNFQLAVELDLACEASANAMGMTSLPLQEGDCDA